ncbi:MAG: ParB/RepB/Spo0J family partition protein [Ruminococcaceae bacterium]|nr:ParB/RepB/Spo0J family partition protein [Oscillospiraceae bacterium]
MKNGRKSEFLSNRVQYISAERICPNPHQPRRIFDEEELQELAASIRSYGVLQPLTVRRVGDRYELVAGERRLRAGRMAGLRELPCLVARVGEEDSALLALIENLQRRDLNCWEEAEAIAQLIDRYGFRQEQAAEKLGRSQSAISNKLRLLRLPQQVREKLQRENLSERHARALLRLSGEGEQLRAAEEIIRRGMNVAQTEAYVEQLLQKQQDHSPRRPPTYIIKDVRLFLNSIDRGLRLIRSAGVSAACGREETEREILLTIRIPKSGVK